MAYKDIVREMFRKHKGKMAAKDIMKLAAAEHRKRGGGVSAGALSHSVRKPKGVKGGGIIGKTLGTVSGLADVFGLGMEKPKRKAKAVKGGGVIGKTLGTVSSLADVFGLGLNEPEGGRFGMPNLISSHGLGLKRGKKSAKGGDLKSFLLGMGGEDAATGAGLKRGRKSAKGGAMLNVMSNMQREMNKMGKGIKMGGALSSEANYRTPSIGNAQPFQPSLKNDFSAKGGGIDPIQAAAAILPFMALL